jgi:ADP-heptose:LPS heptosyltransferase
LRRLLIRPGALGDFLVSLPALEDYGGEIWCAAANVPLVRHTAARAISSTGLDLLELGLGSDEALRGYDEIVSWYGSAREEFRRAVAHLPFRFLPALPDSGPAHEFYARQLGVKPRAPRLDVPRTAGAPYAVIHPYSGSARKNWPLERFEALAARLELPVVWTCGPEETLPERLPQRRFGNTWDLAVWLGNAAVYIGNDSGPTHLARAAGAPAVAIFRDAGTPAVWAPPGAAVLVEPTVEQALAAVRELRR